MSRIPLLGLVAVFTTFVVCDYLYDFTDSEDTLKRASSVRKSKRDTCRPACNNYRGICMHAWLDPANVYEPHCSGQLGEVLPSVSCVDCLKARGLTSSTRATTSRRPPTTELTLPTVPTFPTEPLPTTEPNPVTNPPLGDKCSSVCDSYLDICVPEWLDLEDRLDEHCEDVGDVGKPSAQCLGCLLINGLPNRDVIKRRCQQECFCHREITVKLESPSINCLTHGFCGRGNVSTPPVRSVFDESYCDCEVPVGCDDDETADVSTDRPTEPFTSVPTQSTPKRRKTTERDVDYDEMRRK